eukprot:scaffold14920_cov78-Cyclotella_meneghiniana.AAC.1
MVGEGGDWNSSFTTVTTPRLLSHRWRLEFILNNRHHTPAFESRPIHSIPSLPMCHYKYNEWLEKVEIRIHPQQPSPHPGF